MLCDLNMSLYTANSATVHALTNLITIMLNT